MNRKACLAVSALLFTFSCGGEEPAPARRTGISVGPIEVTPQKAAAAREVDLDTDFVVWTRDPAGVATSHRLDPRGTELETFPGVLVANGGDIFVLREDKQEIATRPCDVFDEEGNPSPGEPVAPGHATRVSLVLAGSEVEQTIIAPAGEAEGAQDLEHQAALIGSVGPYLFFEESTYAYTCGAHGNTGASALIWDAAHGAPVDWSVEPGPVEVARARAIVELTDPDEDMFPATVENTEMAGLVPRFDPDGALRLGFRFAAPTCYACTRGEWGSYQKSAIVDAPSMPAPLASYATPGAVRAFQQAHPGLLLGGWSEVSR